jgi:hypothetical protein
LSLWQEHKLKEASPCLCACARVCARQAYKLKEANRKLRERLTAVELSLAKAKSS